jgi:hypothetical protein
VHLCVHLALSISLLWLQLELLFSPPTLTKRLT